MMEVTFIKVHVSEIFHCMPGSATFLKKKSLPYERLFVEY